MSIHFINKIDENASPSFIAKTIRNDAAYSIHDHFSKSLLYATSEGITYSEEETFSEEEAYPDGFLTRIRADHAPFYNRTIRNKLTISRNAIMKINKVWYEERTNELRDAQIAEIQLLVNLFYNKKFE